MDRWRIRTLVGSASGVVSVLLLSKAMKMREAAAGGEGRRSGGDMMLDLIRLGG